MPFVEGETVVVRQIDDSYWELVEPMTYRAKTNTFIVTKGFKTDFASVPRPFVWLIPRYGRYTKAAILHDYLWRTKAVSSADADGIFRRSMRELDVPIVRRWMMWGAIGLASIVKNFRELLAPGILHVLGLVAVAVLSAVFVVIPSAVVSLWLVIFFVIELLAYPLALVANVAKPSEERASVNRPKLLWKLS